MPPRARRTVIFPVTTIPPRPSPPSLPPAINHQPSPLPPMPPPPSPTPGFFYFVSGPCQVDRRSYGARAAAGWARVCRSREALGGASSAERLFRLFRSSGFETKGRTCLEPGNEESYNCACLRARCVFRRSQTIKTVADFTTPCQHPAGVFFNSPDLLRFETCASIANGRAPTRARSNAARRRPHAPRRDGQRQRGADQACVARARAAVAPG